jgi:sigma-B regulation protein RsbU (phosphoserine phosphatase)
VADVTGEGVAAALQMANFQAAVRVTLAEFDDPGELLTRWNRFICGNANTSRFITCVLALIDPRSRKVSVGSAGHFAPLLIRAEGLVPEEMLVDAGYPLGIDANTAYSSTAHDLGADPCLLFCYTDGITEAFDANGHAFGRDRLVKVLAEQTDLNPHAMIKHLRKQVTAFVGPAEQSDDITMLAASVG